VSPKTTTTSSGSLRPRPCGGEVLGMRGKSDPAQTKKPHFKPSNRLARRDIFCKPLHLSIRSGSDSGENWGCRSYPSRQRLRVTITRARKLYQRLASRPATYPTNRRRASREYHDFKAPPYISASIDSRITSNPLEMESTLMSGISCHDSSVIGSEAITIERVDLDLFD
jgi:hypothetical protein